MAETKTETLAGISLLADLPAADREAIEKRCSWRSYGKGEQIIDRDSDTRDVFFVAEGAVRVVNYSASGREVSYADIPEGGMFGEFSAIDGKPRSASVVARKPSTLAALSPSAFMESVREHPEFAIAVIRRLTQLARESTERILDLSTLGAFGRVYAELLRLARKNMNEEDWSATIQPIPVHSDLASRVGTTRETVARAISELSRKGVAEKRGNALYFPDVMELEDIVEGEAEH